MKGQRKPSCADLDAAAGIDPPTRAELAQTGPEAVEEGGPTTTGLIRKTKTPTRRSHRAAPPRSTPSSRANRRAASQSCELAGTGRWRSASATAGADKVLQHMSFLHHSSARARFWPGAGLASRRTRPRSGRPGAALGHGMLSGLRRGATPVEAPPQTDEACRPRPSADVASEGRRGGFAAVAIGGYHVTHRRKPSPGSTGSGVMVANRPRRHLCPPLFVDASARAQGPVGPRLRSASVSIRPRARTPLNCRRSD